MWTYNQPGLSQVLTWSEWALMAGVMLLLVFAGWQAIKLARLFWDILNGRE